MLVIKILFIMFLFSNHTWAKDNITKIELSANSKIVDVKVINKEIPNDDLNFYGMIIGKSNLSDVEKKFKKGKIISSGDAGKSITYICYFFSDRDEVIYFKSSEMGGKDKTITSVSLHRRKLNSIESQKCSSLKELSKVAVWPSMKKIDLIKFKGQPSKNYENSLIYYYQTERKTELGISDVSSTAEYYFKNNELVELYISKIESY